MEAYLKELEIAKKETLDKLDVLYRETAREFTNVYFFGEDIIQSDDFRDGFMQGIYHWLKNEKE